jgi:hypothetical protein
MKKIMELVIIIFAISFLTSCSSIQKINNFFTIENGIVLPNAAPGTAKYFSINEKGTVEITGQHRITDTHWLYVKCDYWSGCYMRCQGQIDSCKQVAKDSQIEIEYILSRPGWQK